MESTASTMQGKVCLVTGTTSGIGLVTARERAGRGARVVLVGRDPARCAAAVAQIQAQTGNREVETLLADLSSQRQIHDLARRAALRDQGELADFSPGGPGRSE